MTYDQFITRCPEFADTDSALVEATMAGAAAQLDQRVWLAQYDEGHAMLTAHLLALSPFGQNAKMVAKDGSTSYEKHYNRMIRQVAGGFRVI